MINKKFALAIAAYIVIALFNINHSQAQTVDSFALDDQAAELYRNANAALDRKDYDNAIVLYSQAIQLSPDNVGLRRDLAYTLFLQGKVKEANEVIEPVAKSSRADEPTYQLASVIALNLNDKKKAEKYVNEGLKNFPNSGMLYNSKGNLQNDNVKKALQAYNKGINLAPDYPMNYFNAAKLYYADKQAIWTIIYAEIYVNLDRNSAKTAEMKKLLFDAYKLYFDNVKVTDLPKFDQLTKANNKPINTFEDAFNQSMQLGSSATNKGINTESLAILRMRFFINWRQNYAQKYPLPMQDYMDQLIKNGLYETYNQWLFGTVDNNSLFTIWVKQNSTQYNLFEKWTNHNAYSLPDKWIQPN